ncbi:hypothetical protein [Clostridium scatologenes]|uniref:Uncharacterized protein n=1 Tax=Clostridium scatologenes TaxID=1548 RepID=A0A0E3MA20_CLOSL|nr:hypothetical protein [Clostridium scatologenes]AKA70122.1 hypothetical protein CSCA_2997 [Clostridium scatologenes]
MASINYSAVMNTNTSFNQPRQKTWVVFHNAPFWTIKLITTSFAEAQSKAKEILSTGGVFTSIDRIMVCEIAPLDFIMTPNV